MTQHFEQNKNMVQTADGNIYLIEEQFIASTDEETDNDAQLVDDIENEPPYVDIRGYLYPIIYTTDPSLKGVKQLPREMFVRGVDVHSLATKSLDENVDLSKRNFDEGVNLVGGYIAGYMKGYNAKKGEFTMEEVVTIVKLILVTSDEEIHNNTMESLILKKSKKKLYLPQSLTIENDVITKINW